MRVGICDEGRFSHHRGRPLVRRTGCVLSFLIAAVQTGPVATGPEDAVTAAFESVKATGQSPDLVVLPELFSLPFWCVGHLESRYFALAETLHGPTVSTAARHARELGSYAVVPFFERGEVKGEYYNSAVVLDPDGAVVEGFLPSGQGVATYRKNAISSFAWDDAGNDEKYYFRDGPGFPVFRTDVGVLGVLICYDRWFPEAWRVLALQGAEIICVPNASAGAVSDLFVPLMRTRAAENVIFTVGTNRAGAETVDGVTTVYYGSTCIVAPSGDLLAEAGSDAGEVVLARADLEEVERVRHDRTMYRDRRPDLYKRVSE